MTVSYVVKHVKCHDLAHRGHLVDTSSEPDESILCRHTVLSINILNIYVFFFCVCVCPYVRSRESPNCLSLRFILMRMDLARPKRYHPGQNSTTIECYRHMKYRYITPISNSPRKMLKIGLFVTVLNKLQINGIFNYSFFS